MKKKKLFNAIMAVGIVVIMVAGILLVGDLKGWFDGAAAPGSVTSKDLTGIVNIERKGVSYYLDENATLRQGDIIETLAGSAVTLRFGERSYVIMNETTEIVLDATEEGNVKITVNRGEIFADIESGPNTVNIAAGPVSASAENTVFSLTQAEGTQTVYAFKESVSVNVDEHTEALAAGKVFTFIHHEDNEDEISVSALHKNMLNHFILNTIISVSETKVLCISASDARGVIDARAAETEQAAKESQANDSKILAQGGTEQADNEGNTMPDDGRTKYYCTITIRCDTILKNMEDLTRGKGKYVPKNGVILTASRIEFYEGETVFDVLKRACQRAGIQIEYSYTPIYGSYYIEGLNHLYEFDCGEQSGWMYKVNGWYPNYGCSVYKLKDGDVISWNYTCKGLGGDLGAPMGNVQMPQAVLFKFQMVGVK